MEDEHRKEKIQRITFILGILTASVIGFIVNIFASIFYDVVLLGRVQMIQYSEMPLGIISFVLILAIGFLFFLVYDYKNEIDLTRPFFKRFFDYFHNVFWISRQMQRVSRGVIFLFKWLFAIGFGISLYESSGSRAAAIWTLIVVGWVFGKYFFKMWRTKRRVTD